MTPELFIRKICHDLRAPLRGLKEIPLWLEEDLRSHMDPIPEPVLELLNMIKTQATQLDVIVIGLSELVKIEKSEERPVSSVQEVFASDRWPQELRSHFAVDTLPMEAQHLEVAVQHLVDNAFKHAGAAQNSVELFVAKESDGYHIAVRDFGPGIEREYFGKIFDPLYTLKSRDECEASGMGLAVVDKIASLYNGKCTVSPNASGTGMTFDMVIPQAQASERPHLLQR